MLDSLRETFDRTADVVTGVQPDRLDAPTPCEEWNVGDLLNHMVAGNRLFAGVARGEALDLSVFESDNVGDDASGAYRRSADEALEAWQRPGAMEENLSFGDLPGSVVIGLHVVEELVHGWDLATSTGQDTALPQSACELAWGIISAMPEEMMRQGSAFGPAVPIDAEAPIQDRLLAFVGRRPA